MNDDRIPVADLASEWLQDPEFRAEYDALEDEYAQAALSQLQEDEPIGPSRHPSPSSPLGEADSP